MEKWLNITQLCVFKEVIKKVVLLLSKTTAKFIEQKVDSLGHVISNFYTLTLHKWMEEVTFWNWFYEIGQYITVFLLLWSVINRVNHCCLLGCMLRIRRKKDSLQFYNFPSRRDQLSTPQEGSQASEIHQVHSWIPLPRWCFFCVPCVSEWSQLFHQEPENWEPSLNPLFFSPYKPHTSC